MSQFGSLQQEDLVPLSTSEGPLHPCIVPGYLVSIDQEEIQGKGDATYNTLNFNWLLGIPDENGTVKSPTKYRYSEFWPQADRLNEDEFKERGLNLMKRIAYICKYFLHSDREKAEELSLNLVNEGWSTWEELKARVIEHMTPLLKVPNKERKKVLVKLVGNPSNMRVDFPRYIGFIADENSEKELSFSKSEIARNAEYEANLQGKGKRGSVPPGVNGGSEEDLETLSF